MTLWAWAEASAATTRGTTQIRAAGRRSAADRPCRAARRACRRSFRSAFRSRGKPKATVSPSRRLAAASLSRLDSRHSAASSYGLRLMLPSPVSNSTAGHLRPIAVSTIGRGDGTAGMTVVTGVRRTPRGPVRTTRRQSRASRGRASSPAPRPIPEVLTGRWDHGQGVRPARRPPPRG